MKISGWFFGCGATLGLVTGLVGILLIAGGTPFSPGALAAEHPQNNLVSEFKSHADFESHCELCHSPFQGPDATRCLNCHIDVRDQISAAQGVHGQLPDPKDCTACHTDHNGRNARLTRASFADIPHDQFGFSLANHQRDYSHAPMTCRSCHSTAVQAGQIDSNAILAACVTCHSRQDAQFIANHRAAMGEACLACHDGTDRLKGFDHAVVFALDGKHAQVACAKCHVNNRFRGTPTDCAQCHAEPTVHRGQFSTACAACHTPAGWRPASLIRHPFPLDHGGRQSACKVCHAANYSVYTCYNCHEHEQTQIAREHTAKNILDIQECIKCHPTGKKTE